MAAAVSGQGGIAAFNGVTYNVERWKFTDRENAEETTAAQSGGFKDSLHVYREGFGKMELKKRVGQAMPVAGQVGTFTLTGGTEGKTITGTGRISEVGVENDSHKVITSAIDFVACSSYSCTMA